MTLRSMCSVRSQAGTRLSSRYSGRPEANPVNTQISMRRVKSCCQMVTKSPSQLLRLVILRRNALVTLCGGLSRSSNLYPALEPVHRGAAKQIGQYLHFALTGHHTALKHGHAVIAAERFKVCLLYTSPSPR